MLVNNAGYSQSGAVESIPMDAVRRQKPDVPYDSAHPLFAFGHGLTY